MPSTPSSSVLKPHGILIVTAADGNTYQHDCLSCVHCRFTWIVQPGSGKRRGFCTKCMGPTCGAHACDECMPEEKRLDLYEAGKLTTLL